MREARGTLQLANDGVERAVGVMRRAKVAQASMGFAREPLQQHGGEPRFADAWLPRNQDDLTFAVLGPLPATEQELRFLLAANKLGQPGRVQRLEPALDRPRSDCRPGPNRSGETL